MANQTLPAWRDLSRSRRIKVASNLIQTLDEHAFLLLSVLDQPEVIQESTNEIGNDLIRFKWPCARNTGRSGSGKNQKS